MLKVYFLKLLRVYSKANARGMIDIKRAKYEANKVEATAKRVLEVIPPI